MNEKIEKLNLLILGGSSLLSFLWCKATYKNFNIYLSQHQKDISYLGFQILNILPTSPNSKDIFLFSKFKH